LSQPATAADRAPTEPWLAPTQSSELEPWSVLALELSELELPDSLPDFPDSLPDFVDWASLEVLDFASLSMDLAFAAGWLERSFLAQPEPLKTIAGVDNSLRISAPQRGHFCGPDSLTPCITSVMWPLVQM
jgi:hypothetical protein